ncbi:MAG TPA: TonB-dependent receptor [Gemmatimonadales bacterium]|nr:TonB-dependent receptor [Gemmatimonadales bacterium]
MPLPLLVLALLLAGLHTVVAAQDSVTVLPPIGVTAARTATPAGTAGLPVSVLSGTEAGRGRPLPALDELLAFVPGVLASGRGDPTLDDRVALRGTGARANFGIRGIRVLVDGFPATLPDGQSQLGQLIPLAIERIAVARGPLAALHGNGASGVLALETPSGLGDASAARFAVQAGSAGTREAAVGLSASSPRLGATLFAAREASDGLRTHAAFTRRRLQGGITWQPDPANRLLVRLAVQDDPFSASPGALTVAEFAADPRGAAPRNRTLDAGKAVRQQQLGIGWDHSGHAVSLVSRAWILGRDLENPIAAPAPLDPTHGTWIALTRAVRGASSTLTWRVHSGLDLGAGLDVQQMRDVRTNRPHVGAGPDGPAFVDQDEVVRELGGFLHAAWRVHPAVVVRGGVRRDGVRFSVTDRLEPGASGDRTLAATSGSASIAWQAGATEAWLGAGRSFETPTTTELGNRPDGSTGLNRELQPARTTSLEVGLRHGAGRVRLEGAAWTAVTHDAILPAAEIGGRSLFRNVARTTSRGVEFSGDLLLARGVVARAAATVIAARFGPQLVDAEGTPIGGHRLPGIPTATLRLGLTARRGPWSLDVDHAFRGATEAFDDGRQRAEGWGSGITNAALRVSATTRLSLHAVVRNLTDRAVASSVVVNAAGARIIQPLPTRQVSLGFALALD